MNLTKVKKAIEQLEKEKKEKEEREKWREILKELKIEQVGEKK